MEYNITNSELPNSIHENSSIDDFKYNTGDNTTTFKFMNDFSDMVKNAS